MLRKERMGMLLSGHAREATGCLLSGGKADNMELRPEVRF
jgi:hypothetical protein